MSGPDSTPRTQGGLAALDYYRGLYGSRVGWELEFAIQQAEKAWPDEFGRGADNGSIVRDLIEESFFDEWDADIEWWHTH